MSDVVVNSAGDSSGEATARRLQLLAATSNGPHAHATAGHTSTTNFTPGAPFPPSLSSPSSSSSASSSSESLARAAAASASLSAFPSSSSGFDSTSSLASPSYISALSPSSPSHETAGRSGDMPSLQSVRGDAVPAVADGVLEDSPLRRCLRLCRPTVQDLRGCAMLLPTITVVLFATHQNTAGFVMLGFTIAVFSYILYRVVRVFRARQLQQYEQLDPELLDGGIPLHPLSVALGMPDAGGGRRLGGVLRGGRGRGSSARYHSALVLSGGRPSTALRLALQDRDFNANDYEMLLRLDEEHRAQTFTGIPASLIDRLPTYRVPPPHKPSSSGDGDAAATPTKEDMCAVCLEPRIEGQMVRTLMCLHTFHVSCIDPWLRTSKLCPVCQFKVQLPD